MKKLFMRRISLILVLFLMSSAVLNGCGKGASDADSGKEKAREDAAKEAAIIMEQESVDVAETEADEGIEEKTNELPADAVASAAIIQGDKLYLAGRYAVAVMDINTGDFNNLWMSDAPNNGVDIFGNGKAIILGNKLYFYTEYWDEAKDEYCKSLNVIDVNGENYSEIARYSGSLYCTGDMYYRNGILYVDGDGKNDCYSIDEQGNITDTLSRDTMPEFEYKFDQRQFVEYIRETGKMRYSLKEYFENKKIVISDENSEQLLCDVESGREIGLGGNVVAANDNLLLIRSKQSDKNIYGSISLKTGEYKYLFKDDKEKTIIAIDDKYVYSYEKDEEGNAVFYRSSLNNGKENELYSHKVSESRISNVAIDYFTPVKIGNRLLICDSHDYAVYIEEINLDDGSVICAGDSFFDTGISEIGDLTIRLEEVKSDDGNVVNYAYSAVPELDSKFGGATIINRLMKEIGNIPFESLEDSREETLDMYKEAVKNGYSFYGYSFDLRMPFEPFYYEGNILSFYLEGYDYYGGAHGMPYRIPYVFNLETGKKYALSDIVTIPEEDLREMVIEGLLKNATSDDMYNSDDEIREYLEENFKVDEFETFYFTEDGVLFFFGPYELAAFAAGFPEVTISYDKLGIDIKALCEGTFEETETETESEAE